MARFRVHGEPLADPAFLTGTVDLAALEHGGRLLDCSDAFFASAANLIMPGRARGMADGWENARRRGPGNDYAVFGLAAAGVPRRVEIDASHFVGNAPGWVTLRRRRAGGLARAAAQEPGAARQPAPVPGHQPDRSAGSAWTSSRTAAWPGSAYMVSSPRSPWPPCTPAGSKPAPPDAPPGRPAPVPPAPAAPPGAPARPPRPAPPPRL